MKGSFFLDRPILSLAIAVCFLLLGFLGNVYLPVEQFPDVAPAMVEVYTEYPGASAEAVQKSVVVPIETAVNSVDGIDEILSSSTSSGEGIITVIFQPGTDPDIAAVMVKNRIAEVESILPEKVLRNGVQVEKTEHSYLKMIAIESPDGRYDNDFITNLMDINVIPRLQRIKGVGRIELLGSVYAIRIWLDPKKMGAFMLEPKDIAEALEDQNIEAAIGTLGEDSENTFQYTLVYKGRLVNTEEFGNIVIRSEGDGDDLRLRDVARIEIGRESYASESWVNTHPGVVALITQANGSNARQVNHEIDQEIERVKTHLPPGLEFRTLLDTNDFLDASIKEVYKTLFETILLVILVVGLFLQNRRATLIPAIAIIVSLVGTFAFMYVAGFTLNLITLFALVLVTGTVVDDAIVVVEAVQSQLDGGEHKPYEATCKALQNIRTTIVTTTVVFMAVFIPISFISGLAGTYYRQFGVTMAVAVAISTICALTITPTLCVLLMKPREGESNRFYKAFNASYAAFAEKYTRGLSVFFRHKWFAAVLTVFVIIMLTVLARMIPTGLIPDEDTGNILVDVTTPPGSTLAQTKKTIMRAAEKMADIDEIEHCASVAGWNMLSDGGPNTGMLIIKLKHWDERPGSEHEIDAVVEKIEQRMDSIKSGQMFTYALPTVTGYGYSYTIDLHVQDFEDRSVAELKEVTDSFITALEQRKEIDEAYCSYEVNFPQYTVSVNAAICKRYGVAPSAVLSVLNGYIASNYVSQFNAFGKTYHVMLQADPILRNDKEDLDNIFVIADDMTYIPVKELVALKKSYGVHTLNRFNLYSSISLEVLPAPGYSTGETMKAIDEVAQANLPYGYGFEYTGTAKEEVQTNQSRMWLLLIVILLIYIVLCALYESLFIPLAVLICVSFGLFGCHLSALLCQTANNIYMQVGIVMLIGLLAKTAILMTEYATQRRKEGMSLREAAISAAKERLRPILMTVTTLVIGLLPLVFSSGAMAVGCMTLGLCVIGGMLVGTLSILFLLPILFVLFRHLDEQYIAKRIKATNVIVLLALVQTVTSCKTYSDYQSEPIATDRLLRTDIGVDAGEDATAKSWREVFTEPRLAALIEEGLAHNSDLNIAKLRVDAAKATLRNAKGELLPSLSLGADGETARFKNSGNEAQTASRFKFGAEVSWEADIFGKLQNARKAAAADVEEQAAYVQAVQVELIATTAASYFQLEMYDAQIAETRDIVNSWDESIKAQKALMAVGDATSDEVSLAEACKLAAEETLENLQRQMIQTENALCTLLGRYSGHINRGDFQSSCEHLLQMPKVNIQALAARPDIHQAEAALKKAFYATNEARAALYPSLNLSGIIGWTNDIDEVVSPAGLITKALGSLTQPIFANGRLRAEVKKAKAEQEEAKTAFRQSILEAGQEVNDILATYQYAQRAINLGNQQVEHLADVLRATEKRMCYDDEVNYLQVLLARQSLLEARLSLHEHRFSFVEATIQLYKALGGGMREI